MNLTEAFDATRRVFRRRPTDLLPFYALGAAVSAIVRSVSLLGLVVVYVYLAVTGRLVEARTLLADRDVSPPDPDADPEAFAAWTEGLDPLVQTLLDPVVAALLGVTAVVSLVLFLLLSAGVTAGQYGACAARLRSDRGLVGGIRATGRHWSGIVGLLLLEGAIWIGATLAAGLVVGVVALAAPVLGVLVGLAAGFVWLVVVLSVRAVFAFAPVALVVDDAGVGHSIRASLGFLRANPIEAIGYFVVVLGGVFALSLLAGILSVVGAASLIGLVGLLLLAPALDLVKTGLFVGHRGGAAPPISPDVGVLTQFKRGLGRGWRELGGFVRETPGLHALSVVFAVVGFGLGWVAVESYAYAIETSIAARLADHVPPAAALEFFANNWIVALSTAFAGVAFAVPAAAALWFNGFVFGIYARSEVELREFLLFVAPHGIIEIPALFIAGAVGLWLGLVGIGAWRGTVPRVELADALDRAFWVLVGVGILLAIAAAIEGFVSPYYYQPFL